MKGFCKSCHKRLTVHQGAGGYYTSRHICKNQGLWARPFRWAPASLTDPRTPSQKKKRFKRPDKKSRRAYAFARMIKQEMLYAQD